MQAQFCVVLNVLYTRLVCPSPDPVHHLCAAFSRGKKQQLATRLTADDSLYRINKLKPCMSLVRKLGLHVKIGKDQNPQKALNSVILEKENGMS